MATPVSINKGLVSQFSEYGIVTEKNIDVDKDKSIESSTQLEIEKVEQENSNPVDKEVEQEDIKSAIEIIAGFINVAPRSVNFQQHEDSEKTIIKVFDNDTQELIRQFPSEEVLEIAKKIVALREDVGRKTGILLDEKI